MKTCGARTVLDLGCGEGRLLRMLIREKQFTSVVGMDVSNSALKRAEGRLNPDRLPPRVAAKLKLIHGSLVYRDRRLLGYDAAAVVEVIEHLDLHRLRSFERVLFQFCQPNTVVLTTPNRDYNVMYENIAEGAMRHRDHRFEWSREEFKTWADGVADRHGYTVEIQPVGPLSEEVGAPSQLAVFSKKVGE